MNKMSEIYIEATDGYKLSARLFIPTNITTCIVINGGTGIKKEFYWKFASWLSTHGFLVLTYDYRGIGGSRPKSLVGFNTSLVDWGRLDATATLDYLITNYPSLPRYVIGHIIGGRLLGLMPNYYEVDGIFNIGVSTGNWRNMLLPQKIYSLFKMKLLVPSLTSVVRYFPSNKLKMGEDLPLGVAVEWAKWCNNKKYFSPYLIHNHLFSEYDNYFHAYTCNMQSVYFSDDYIATDSSVKEMNGFYRNASIEVTKYKPLLFGLNKVGHLGFFKSVNQALLWPIALKHIDRIKKANTGKFLKLQKEMDYILG